MLPKSKKGLTIVNPFLTLSGISSRSFSLSFGIKTVLMPARNAANSFSFNPPIGKTLPNNVISPVMAISLETGIPVMAETKDVHIAIPADGPSYGVAPSGTWM